MFRANSLTIRPSTKNFSQLFKYRSSCRQFGIDLHKFSSIIGKRWFPSRWQAVEPVQELKMNKFVNMWKPRSTTNVCSAYCTAEAYDKLGIQNYLNEKCGRFEIFENNAYLADFTDYFCGDRRALTNSNDHDNERQKKVAFYFPNYGVVFWGMTLEEERLLLEELQPFAIKPYPEFEHEELDYREEETRPSGMKGETLIVNASQSFDKYIFSVGIVRSTKLAMFEKRLEETQAQMRNTPEQLAMYGNLHLNHKNINRRIGLLLTLRLNITRVSQEEPDICWEDHHLHNLFNQISRTFDMKVRSEALSKSLNDLDRLLDVLRTHSAEVQTSRLEKIIILLILIEVLFSVEERGLFIGAFFPYRKRLMEMERGERRTDEEKE